MLLVVECLDQKPFLNMSPLKKSQDVMGPRLVNFFKCFWQKWDYLFIQLCSVLVLPKQCLQWLSPCSCCSQAGPGERLSIRWVQQHQRLDWHQISLQDDHRALLQSPKGTCFLFRKFCIFSCCICKVRDSLGCTCFAAIIAEPYIDSTKHSLFCLGWSNRKLSATSSTADREHQKQLPLTPHPKLKCKVLFKRRKKKKSSIS